MAPGRQAGGRADGWSGKKLEPKFQNTETRDQTRDQRPEPTHAHTLRVTAPAVSAILYELSRCVSLYLFIENELEWAGIELSWPTGYKNKLILTRNNKL